MKYAKKLRKGDKVAIVSLSSGMLGEAFCSHNIEIGVKRLREYGLEPSFMPNSLKGIEYLKANPKARAKDLKDAFMDDSIAGIICAIGGDDTYRLLPYLLEDEEFIDAVHKSPKLFTGFSDTTINHLMFYKLGLSTYYGPNFICDLAEISDEMLPYSKKAFESYIEGNEYREITSSEIWYQERTDFSKEAVGTERISHREEHGFELLQGKECFEGRLLGGCLESLSNLHMLNPYGSIPILDDDGDSTGWNIYMFRADDKGIQNIINSSYAVIMELPECITDYDSFFEDLGFPKEVVRNGDVRIIKSNSRYITISYGDKSKEIEKSRLEKYKVMVRTKCVVLKIKALWNSSENNLYGIDKKKAIKCIPDIENYEYVPVNNSMLAKAEIPFLIFERNRGKCFIEMY